MNIVVALIMHEAIAVVFASEALDFAAFVLQRPAVDAVRHADVKRAGVAAHDVDEILVLCHCTLKAWTRENA